MGWVITILFASAVVLLILSFIKTTQSKATLKQQIEQVSFSLKNEVHDLQEQVRNFEIDVEILAQRSRVSEEELQERIMLREMIDMQRRGYSFESIASKKQLTEKQVKQMLAPYVTRKDEGSRVGNDS